MREASNSTTVRYRFLRFIRTTPNANERMTAAIQNTMKRSFLTFFVGLISVMYASAQSQYAFTDKATVNLRQTPSTTGAKVGSLTKGLMIPLVEADWESGWYKVMFNGKEAYVAQSVSNICDAEIPRDMLGKTLESTAPADKIRFQGDITIRPVGKTHAVIEVTWMRTNLPAETWNWLADVNADGTIVATHQLMTPYVDTDQPIEKIMEDADKLDSTIPVGFGEFNNTLYFNGWVFSEFE